MTPARKMALTALLALALTSIASTASAGAPIRQGGNFGIGLGGGTVNSGLSLKYFTTSSQSLQGTIGFNLRADYIGATVDYLFEMPTLVSSSVVDIGWAIGPGVGIGVSDNFFLAAVSAAPGLEFNFNPIPIDLVLEWRPTVVIVPDVDFDLIGFTGHIRFYF